MWQFASLSKKWKWFFAIAIVAIGITAAGIAIWTDYKNRPAPTPVINLDVTISKDGTFGVTGLEVQSDSKTETKPAEAGTPKKPETSPEGNSEEKKTSGLGLLNKLAIAQVCLLGLVVGTYIVILLLRPKGKDGTTKTGEAGKAKSWSQWADEWFDTIRDFVPLYPVWFLIGWFLIPWLAWIFKEEYDLWKWLWVDNQKLYIWTGIFIIVGVWFAIAKHRLLKFPGFLMWFILACFWIGVIGTTIAESPTVQRIKAEKEAEDARKNPTRFNMVFKKPADVDGARKDLRDNASDPYPTTLIRDDPTVMEFVYQYQHRGEWKQGRMHWDKVLDPEKGQYFQTTPTIEDDPRGPIKGEFILTKNPDGRGYNGTVRDQYTNGNWVPLWLVPID